MGKIWLVMRREYVERVRNRQFWILTLLLPGLLLAVTLVPVLLSGVSPKVQKRIAVVDETGRVFAVMEKSLARNPSLRLEDGRPEYVLHEVRGEGAGLPGILSSLKDEVAANELYGVLVIGEDPEGEGGVRLYARNVSNAVVVATLKGALDEALVVLRLERERIDATREEIARILAGAEIVTIQVTAEGERSRSFESSYMGTIIFTMILYMTFLGFGSTMVRGILEEKTARIIEVLLSSFSPFQLLMGKILGLALVGLTQLGVYGLAFGAAALAGAKGRASMDPKVREFMEVISPSFMLYFAVFFLLGYFLFSTMFAALGSLCNTEQEAHNLQRPLMLVLFVPLLSTIYLVQNPDAGLVRLLSLIPLFTPMVMFMRITVLTPPFWEIGLSVALLVAAIVAIGWVASKIFRVSILMYGKKPGLQEVFRWVRAA